MNDKSFDREAMVRSCITWDSRAVDFANRLSKKFWGGWMDPERIDYRGQHPEETYEALANFMWEAEDLMNETARTLWPQGSRQHAVAFPEHIKSKLRWWAILRKRAWLTLLEVRDRIVSEYLKRPLQARVAKAVAKGSAFRLGTGELWEFSEATELIFQVWKRYTVFSARDRIVRRTTGHHVDHWEGQMGRDIERAGKQNDTRRMWGLLRTLGGTGRKSRKRNSRDVKREDPEIPEWVEAMAKPGGREGARPRTLRHTMLVHIMIAGRSSTCRGQQGWRCLSSTLRDRKCCRSLRK